MSLGISLPWKFYYEQIATSFTFNKELAITKHFSNLLPSYMVSSGFNAVDRGLQLLVHSSLKPRVIKSLEENPLVAFGRIKI